MNKFTVIIPLYNKGYIFERCISSVLSQTYLDYNIVIVDDGSTDESIVIAEKYKERYKDRIILLRQENSGVSTARNNGAKNARSEYICFLDADDEWTSDFLENINTLIVFFPTAALYCLQHETKINGEIVKNNSSYKEGHFGLVDDFFKRSLSGSLANSSKICIRKDVFEILGGFPEGQKSGEDLFVWMKIALSYPVAVFNIVSARINVISDLSRKGRSVSVPYPFIYYSEPDHKRKLSFWAKLYLYKIFIMHLGDSIKAFHYEGFIARLEAGKKLFPITCFFLTCLRLPIRVVSRNE